MYPESNKIIYLISTTSNSIDSPYDIQTNIDTNITILLDRLKCAYEYGVKEFNFISSWYVYGKPTFSTSTYSNGKTWIPVFRESDYCNPSGFYSITKRTAEQLIIEFCAQYNIRWRIMRLSNIYGSDKNASKKKNILHYFIDCLSRNEQITLYGTHGPVWRDYVHISDACRAIMHLSKNSPVNTIYNIGRGPAYAMDMETIVSMAKGYLKSTSPICFSRIKEDSIPGHIEAASLNNDKLLTTNFKFQVPLEQGLKELCNTYCAIC